MPTPTFYKLPSFLYWILALLLTTIACAALTRGAPTEPPTISEPPSNGLIAYLGTDGNIYTIDETGQNPIPITQDAKPQFADNSVRVYQHLTWSHNGRYLAFAALELIDGEQTSRILVTDRETGKLTEIFSNEEEGPFYLYWSPDNETISFLTSAPNTVGLNLRLAFLNGEESRVADTGQPYYWMWSPDGKEIFVHKGGSTSANPNARLATFFSENGKTQTFQLPPGNFQAPGWSPNGEHLLAALEKDDERILTLLDRNGTTVENLTDFSATIAFSWSPNGEQIAIRPTTLDSGGFYGPLTILTADNPATLQITPEDTVMAYFWAPDSQQIAYFTLDTSSGIDALISAQTQQMFTLALHVMDIQTGATRRLTTFEPTDAFLSILPFFDQYHHSHTIWSPDSTQLVYTALSGENDSSVWVAQADGSLPVQIANGTLAFWSWK
jgi:TolB protein